MVGKVLVGLGLAEVGARQADRSLGRNYRHARLFAGPDIQHRGIGRQHAGDRRPAALDPVAGLDLDAQRHAGDRRRDRIDLAHLRPAFLVDRRDHRAARHLAEIHRQRARPERPDQRARDRKGSGEGEPEARWSLPHRHSRVLRVATMSILSMSRFTAQPETAAAASTAAPPSPRLSAWRMVGI